MIGPGGLGAATSISRNVKATPLALVKLETPPPDPSDVKLKLNPTGANDPVGSSTWMTGSAAKRAVTVAVRRSTPPTFQAFTSDPLCAQGFCKLLDNCELPKDGCDRRR